MASVRNTGWDHPSGIRESRTGLGAGLELSDGCACPRCGGEVRVQPDSLRAWCSRKVSAGGCGSEWAKSRRGYWTPPRRP